MYKIALIDDHSLIRKALEDFLNAFEEYEVILSSANGEDFLNSLDRERLPDIALLDINMPVLDGFSTAERLRHDFPSVKVVALSMNNSDEDIIKMLRMGAKGYLSKDISTSELRLALNEVINKGYYHSDLVANTLLNSLNNSGKKQSLVEFQAREEEFLHLACSEMTYKEIADKMCVSPRTVDGYRESLFLKLEIKSRVGLVLFAIKNGIVEI